VTRGDHTVVYEDKAGAWRWKRVAGNGEIIAVGESHPRKADAERSASRAFLSPETHPDDPDPDPDSDGEDGAG
jgi:hypothetical protein